MPRVIGVIQTSATDEVPLYLTAYTEQTTGAQRSLKSASANDAALGTGVRSVKITYYTLASDGTIAGPFSETVVMNGTTAVATVATDIALIEKMEAVTVGSGGQAAGAITLYDDAAGVGSAIASIAQSFSQTLLAHHYIASGKRCHITDISLSGGAAAAVRGALKRKAAPFTNAATIIQAGPVVSTSTVPASVPLLDHVYTIIPGPARIRMEIIPGDVGAQLTIGSFAYYEI